MAETKDFSPDRSAPRSRQLQTRPEPNYDLRYIFRDSGAGRLPRHLISRFGIWHYYRRVPQRFRKFDARTFVTISLETRDLRRAEQLKGQVEKELEAYWVSLAKGESTDARERYLGAIERARLEGFEYRPAAELAGGDVGDLLARIGRLEELLELKKPGDAPLEPAERSAVDALAGLALQPELTLSKALDQFYDFTRDKVRRKSPDQLRRWRAPRLKAVNNLIALVGDKRVSEVTRADALALRRFWVERVVEEGYTANSANKDLGHLAQMLDTLDEALQLGLGQPFAKLRLEGDRKATRAAFQVPYLRDLVLDADKLAGLNPEARGILHAMIETGMRPIEICGLEADDILLDVEVPHVKVRPKQRDLKTTYSERDIPLVGISLAALQAFPEGFPRYFDRSSQLSAAVNSYLSDHHLLPTDNHSLYSIRHTFKDRLIAAEMQDRMQDELMGHKSPRPVYGAGPTLAHKREWLRRIAIT
jgi:integrase